MCRRDEPRDPATIVPLLAPFGQVAKSAAGLLEGGSETRTTTVFYGRCLAAEQLLLVCEIESKTPRHVSDTRGRWAFSCMKFGLMI